MSEDIKKEFKDFIGDLSTEICKDVLLEDLKFINRSFEDTKNNYTQLFNEYSEKYSELSMELNCLKDTNKLINNINSNVDNVDVHQKEIIDNINSFEIELNRNLKDVFLRKQVEILNKIHISSDNLDKKLNDITNQFRKKLNVILAVSIVEIIIVIVVLCFNIVLKVY